MAWHEQSKSNCKSKRESRSSSRWCSDRSWYYIHMHVALAIMLWTRVGMGTSIHDTLSRYPPNLPSLKTSQPHHSMLQTTGLYIAGMWDYYTGFIIRADWRSEIEASVKQIIFIYVLAGPLELMVRPRCSRAGGQSSIEPWTRLMVSGAINAGAPASVTGNQSWSLGLIARKLCLSKVHSYL